MLSTLRPIQFNRKLYSGRTKPSILTCEGPDRTAIEVVAKFSAGCEAGVAALAMEVIGACLAADLGLPVPQPYLIQVDSEWAETIPDAERKDLIKASSPIAFGSKLVTGGFVS